MAFHVNPESGVPGQCHAKNGKCPYGGADAHGETAADAIKAFEASVSTPLFTTAQKASADELNGFLEAKAASAAAEAEMNKYGSGTQERKDAWDAYRAALATERGRQLMLERKGLGHMIPDDGKTIRVANMAQKILLTEELQGQISDGMWENSSPDWQDWSGATVIVDPQNLGRNWHARKDNYQLNSSNLLDIVGDRMIEYVQTGNNDPSYDMKKMRRDLADLRHVFKTGRGQHDGSGDLTPSHVPDAPSESGFTKAQLDDVAVKATDTVADLQRKQEIVRKMVKMGDTEGVSQAIDAALALDKAVEAKKAPAVAKTALPTAPKKAAAAKASNYAKNVGDHTSAHMVGAAIAGPGQAKPKEQYYTLHCGMANPTNGDGDDYDHIADGGVVIVGKRDGSRARVIAGSGEQYADPGENMGRPVNQIKQRHNGPDAATDGLYVLGYRDRNGNSWGWVPNKKIQYFVFK